MNLCILRGESGAFLNIKISDKSKFKILNLPTYYAYNNKFRSKEELKMPRFSKALLWHKLSDRQVCLFIIIIAYINK